MYLYIHSSNAQLKFKMDCMKNILFAKAQLTTEQNGQTHPCYVCPICLRAFTDVKELTLEHVPPKSLGGKPLCLTCVKCNNSAGHTVDAALNEEHKIAESFQPNSGPQKVHLIVGDAELRVTIDRTPGNTNIEVIEKANDPRIVVQAMEKLRDGVARGDSFRLQYRGNYTRRLAEIGSLKSAYLIAFAKFGYRYIFQEALKPVRTQLNYPDEAHIEPICATIRSEEIPHQAILLIDEPSEWMGIRWNNRLVILPGLINADVNFWRVFSKRKKQGGIDKLDRCKVLDWPEGMEMLLDPPFRPRE